MGKVSYHFFICFFNAILCYILLINYLGWSGGYIDILGMTAESGKNFESSYFGFQSVRMMLSDLNASITYSAGSLSLDNLLEYTRKFLNSVFIGLPKLASMIANNNWNPLDIFELVLNLFAQPIMVVVYSFCIIGILVYWVIVVLGVLFKAFGGSYNIPFTNTGSGYAPMSDIGDLSYPYYPVIGCFRNPLLAV